MSDTSVNHELILISQVLTVCINDQSIHIPQGKPYVKNLPKEKGKSRRVSNEEIDAITLATQSKLLGSVLILAIETAMSRAEISGIEHKHINLSKRTLTLLETKNGETRIVPLSTKAIQVIQSLPRNISGKISI